MANKLISDLSSAAVLVTDLIEHQPIAGPPSKKGTVTAVFTAVDGNLAIDRDNRQLLDSSANNSVDWEHRILINSSADNVVDWENRKLYTGTTSVIEWSAGLLNDSPGGFGSVQWFERKLLATDGSTIVLNYSSQQPSSGPKTAGTLYDATTKTMIQEMYDALRAYGLLS